MIPGPDPVIIESQEQSLVMETTKVPHGSTHGLSHVQYCLSTWEPLLKVGNGLEDTGREKEKLGRSERLAWTYIHYQM